MDENLLVGAFLYDEAVAFGFVVEFYGAFVHRKKNLKKWTNLQQVAAQNKGTGSAQTMQWLAIYPSSRLRSRLRFTSLTGWSNSGAFSTSTESLSRPNQFFGDDTQPFTVR